MASATATNETGPLTALVLGGGGSRGAIAVGLYRALVELGVQINLIIATSIGAINGAFIAAGMSPGELEARWRSLRTRNVVGSRWQFLRLLTGASSVFGNHNLRRLLQNQLPVHSFRELRIPLVILGTDLETGDSVELTKGNLIEAILASTALPGFFPPIEREGRRLVDGGLSNNVPIDVAVDRGAGRVFGMLCSCAKGLPGKSNFITVLGQCFSLAINARFRCDQQLFQPRVQLHILEPCLLPNLELLDFDRAGELIEPAYQYAMHELRPRLA